MCIYTHTYTMEYYSAIKKKENLSFAVAWMGLEDIKWNKSARERQILYDLTYMWYLKQNKPKYEQTNWVHGYKEQIAGYQRWGGEVGGSVGSGLNGWRGLKSGNPQL